MSADVLETLLQSPALPEILQQVQNAWDQEQKLRQKFHADITPERKWEFIQGEAIQHPPEQNRNLKATKNLYQVMDSYVRVHRLGVVYIEKAMTSFPRNDYEPDIMFFGTAKAALMDPDTLRFPIPDLIVEVLSPSTAQRDRGIKFQDYGLHRVGEYWIVDPVAESVEIHTLEGDSYPAAPVQTEGLLVSELIAGFEIPVRALFDEAENRTVMRQIWAEEG